MAHDTKDVEAGMDDDDSDVLHMDAAKAGQGMEKSFKNPDTCNACTSQR